MLFSACVSVAWAEKLHEEAGQIAAHIAGLLNSDMPVFLDIRCGEWTPALSQCLRDTLLERSFDLREAKSRALFDPDNTNMENSKLSDYGINSAILISVELNLKWQVVERKSFLSYRSERIPVYSFITKQIQLPEYRLLSIDHYDFAPQDNIDSSISAPRLKWFEPLIASTAVASIIFLLWTIE